MISNIPYQPSYKTTSAREWISNSKNNEAPNQLAEVSYFEYLEKLQMPERCGECISAIYAKFTHMAMSISTNSILCKGNKLIA